MDDFPNFLHFRYVLEVVEQRGFRAAAEKLNITQPSLSRHVKAFEERFKFSLFDESKSGRLEPTPEAESFKLLAQELLKMRDETVAALLTIKSDKSSVFRIGCSSLVPPEVFSQACALYRQLNPMALIHPMLNETGPLLDKLKADSIDAAILTLPIHDQQLRVMNVREDSLVICLPENHPLATKIAISPSDLQGRLKIFRQPALHPAAHDRLVAMLGDIGIAMEDCSHVSHPSEAMRLVKDGYGFALLSEGTVLESGLVTRRILGTDWTVDTVMVFKRDTPLKTLAPIARSLRRKFGSSPATSTPKKHAASVVNEKKSRQKDLFG